jgi:hypothetical protein
MFLNWIELNWKYIGYGASGDELNCNHFDIFCVGVVYSGEYDACDVTRSECISTPGELEKYARPRWESNQTVLTA